MVRRFDDLSDASVSHLGVVRLAADTGTPNLLGNVPDLVFNDWEAGEVHFDKVGNLYFNNGQRSVVALDQTLNLLGTHALQFNGSVFQFDADGNIVEEKGGAFNNVDTPGTCTDIAASDSCYGVYLRKSHF
jgi:hypothetical protein